MHRFNTWHINILSTFHHSDLTNACIETPFVVAEEEAKRLWQKEERAAIGPVVHSFHTCHLEEATLASVGVQCEWET